MEKKTSYSLIFRCFSNWSLTVKHRQMCWMFPYKPESFTFHLFLCFDLREIENWKWSIIKYSIIKVILYYFLSWSEESPSSVDPPGVSRVSPVKGLFCGAFLWRGPAASYECILLIVSNAEAPGGGLVWTSCWQQSELLCMSDRSHWAH